ncbi:hypothetical protein AK812_SmicGene46080 [Symbiodinium microadriaticum]|uniref:Uncharacterized protein n=1 Tax=Symbiodinium microadriaticum TaxID=2951 RepID=A0A1Q9BUW7_SYMMI|nr:hypothetical protein AK812_SmicGene46080 [Symbiodinium microadriaticum]
MIQVVRIRVKAAVLRICGREVSHSVAKSWTPLCLAAEEGHLAVCRVLLDAGAKAGSELMRSRPRAARPMGCHPWAAARSPGP